MGTRVWRALTVAALPLALTALALPVLAGTTERVSVSTAGTQGDYSSAYVSISADGRSVAFHSLASNLVPGDTNGHGDVFVHDRLTGVTERVSVSSAGEQGDNLSRMPDISANGRFVAFDSLASDLVPGDTNGGADIFVHDRLTGVTERVSVSSAGEQSDGDSYWPSTSADGRFVAFDSSASNIAPGDTNHCQDVFVHDRLTGVTERTSVSSAGEQAYGDSSSPDITSDGRCVVFTSRGNNLVPGDTNGRHDMFVHDRLTGVTERVSVSSSGGQGNGECWYTSISADGRFVAFDSEASNLVPGDTNDCRDVFVHDRLTGITERVSVSTAGTQGDLTSHEPRISADGRFVAFDSEAPNLVPGDTNDCRDVFVHDRLTGITERVSVSTAGEQGSFDSYETSVSADGRCVAFRSGAFELVPNDSNRCEDVFVHDREGTPPVVVEPDSPYPSEDEWASGTWHPHRGQLHAHYMPDSVEPWVDSYHLVGGVPVGVALGPIPAAGAAMSAARAGVVGMYGILGYDFVALTEHHPDTKFGDYTWEKAFEDASIGGVLSLVGAAEDTADTHILGVGFGPATDPDTMGGDGSLEHLEDRLSNVTDNGGLAFAAHPDSTDYPWRSPTLNRLKNMAGRYQGLELYNTAVHYTAYRHGMSAPLEEGFAVDAWDDLLHTGWNEVRTTWGTAGDDYTPNYITWIDDACVVVWTPSPDPDQDQIKEALRVGRFYACKGGSHAPVVTAYWVDSEARTISLQVPLEPADERHYRVTFARGRYGRAPVDAALVDQGDATCVATYRYNSDDRYVRAEVRDDRGNTSWLQPIWIDQTATSTAGTTSAAATLPATKEAPIALDMEGAHLTVSVPQSALTQVTGTLLNGEDRPVGLPMGFMSLCYGFTPEVALDGSNSLTIDYYPDSVRGFPDSALAIYQYDVATTTWLRLASEVNTPSGTVTAAINSLGIFAVSTDSPADIGAPTVAITFPGAGAEVGAVTAVTAEASDDQGVATTRFYIDGWPLGTDNWGGDGWLTALDPAHYTTGPKTITAIAEDGVGNESAPAEVRVLVTGGMPPPALSIASPGPDEVLWGDLTAAGDWAGQLPMALGAFTLDDEPVTAIPPPDGSWAIAVPIAPEQIGERTLGVTGFDMYGNRAEAAVNVTLRAFVDIPLDHWARGQIYAAARAGVVQGYSDNTYRPELAVTRDQMAVYIARALAGGDDAVPSGPGEPTFGDVATDHWAYRYIEYCSGHDVVEGYPDGGYHPGEVVNRGQMAVYVARSVATPTGDAGVPDLPLDAEPTFTDVPGTDSAWEWCWRYVEYCATEGIVQGYWDGTYHPEREVTRDQMAVYVQRAFELPL